MKKYVSFEIYKGEMQANDDNVLKTPYLSDTELIGHCHYTITDKYTNTAAWLEENIFSKYKD